MAPVVERRAPRLGVTQIPPPAGLVTPPSDATKTGSGLIYKKTAVSVNGVQAKRTDTVLVNYTGWRQSTGVTFFTTKARRSPIAINVARSSPSFAEALPLMKTGEKMVVWVPPGEGTTETLVYELELADIVVPPPVEPAGQAARRTTSH